MRISFVLMKCISVILIIVIFLNACDLFKKNKNAETSKKNLLRVCPDEWYEDRMPQMVSDSSEKPILNQYFIIAEERKEIKDYDIEWIKKNCPIKSPSIVQ